MTELSPEARRLLGLARRGDDPLETDRLRVNHRMAQRLALAAGFASAALGTTKAATGAAAFSTLLGKGILTGVLVTAAAFGTWKTAEHVVSLREANRTTSIARHRDLPKSVRSIGGQHTAYAQESVSEQAQLAEQAGAETERHLPPKPGLAQATKPTSSAEVVDDLARPSMREADASAQSALPDHATGTARSGLRSSAPAEHPNTVMEDPLSAESAALRAVQYAINSGDMARALRLLDEQDATYHTGALVPERAAARIVVLCKQSRELEARQLAQRFQRRFANSPLIARVNNACASGLGTAEPSTGIPPR